MTIEEENKKELDKIKKQMLLDTEEKRALMINPIYYPPISSDAVPPASKINEQKKPPGKPNPLK